MRRKGGTHCKFSIGSGKFVERRPQGAGGGIEGIDDIARAEIGKYIIGNSVSRGRRSGSGMGVGMCMARMPGDLRRCIAHGYSW